MFNWKLIEGMDDENIEQVVSKVHQLAFTLKDWKSLYKGLETRVNSSGNQDMMAIAEAGNFVMSADAKVRQTRSELIEIQLSPIEHQLSPLRPLPPAANEEVQNDRLSKRLQLNTEKEEAKAILERAWPEDLHKLADLLIT